MRILLLVADSLRPDFLGCYNPARRTRVVDLLAADGARFETAVASAPWTVPAIASICTGVAAQRLGLVRWEQPWSPAAATLFSRLRAGGFQVASFVFEPAHLFFKCPEAAVAGSSQDPAAMRAWFADRGRGGYFAFVHYWWTHLPYLPRRFALAEWDARCKAQLATLADPDPWRREKNRAALRELYARAVDYFSEEWLPALLKVARPDFLIITADHGESWGERMGTAERPRRIFDLHGRHLFNEVLEVPLIMHAPGLVRPGVVRGIARSIDIMPTVLALAGVREGGDAIQGVSLLPAMERGIAANGPAFFARNRDFAPEEALPESLDEAYAEIGCREGRWKVIRAIETGAARAYDLAEDPGERRPFTPREGPSAELLRALDAEISQAARRLDPRDYTAVRAQLAQLGYL